MEHAEIYARHAEAYDELVRAEDCDGHLIPAIDSIHPLAGAAVLEIGVGTGRIAGLVVDRVRRLVALDRAAAMLTVARRRLASVVGSAPHALLRAEARDLPVASGWADVAIAGWVFGHFREWLPAGWRAAIARALDEMRRALRPGGTVIVIETLGTGSEEPAPPSAGLGEYYAWLEGAQGMRRHAVRTDYRFPDVETAARVTGFFFGDGFAGQVRRQAWSRVPECTGIWWLRAPG